MSDEPKTSHTDYDAILDLSKSPSRGARAYALVKYTFEIGKGACSAAEPIPLFHDLRDESLEPRVHPGTDFWPYRPTTDFVVQGSAFGSDGSAVSKRRVSAQIGDKIKHVDVFGKREIQWVADGRVRIGEPQPFQELPLIYENAYGGLDWRVPVPNADDPEVRFNLEVDHPGMYPRNLLGKGYLVEPGEVPDMEMPNLEDPADLLTEERLIVGDPRHWWKQPRPWCFDWVNIAMFPRYVRMGFEADAWYPGPEDEQMPEVKFGDLPSRYRSDFQDRELDQGPHPLFYQGASAGFILTKSPLGKPITLVGMHPEHDTIEFQLPSTKPKLEFEIDGERFTPEPRLHSVVCLPAELRVTMLWAADVMLPRAFIPGIHKHIPISVRINGDDPIAYEAPPTVREETEKARARAEVEQDQAEASFLGS